MAYDNINVMPPKLYIPWCEPGNQLTDASAMCPSSWTGTGKAHKNEDSVERCIAWSTRYCSPLANLHLLTIRRRLLVPVRTEHDMKSASNEGERQRA